MQLKYYNYWWWSICFYRLLFEKMQIEVILAFQSAWLPPTGMEIFSLVNFVVLIFWFPPYFLFFPLNTLTPLPCSRALAARCGSARAQPRSGTERRQGGSPASTAPRPGLSQPGRGGTPRGNTRTLPYPKGPGWRESGTPPGGCRGCRGTGCWAGGDALDLGGGELGKGGMWGGSGSKARARRGQLRSKSTLRWPKRDPAAPAGGWGGGLRGAQRPAVRRDCPVPSRPVPPYTV